MTFIITRIQGKCKHRIWRRHGFSSCVDWGCRVFAAIKASFEQICGSRNRYKKWQTISLLSRLPIDYIVYCFWRFDSSTNLNWDSICFKRFNNYYILLLNSLQTLENTGFIAGELSLIVSLVLYRPTSVYELW